MGANSVRVLAFDCSTASGSVAVVEEGISIFTECFESPRGRGGEFFPALQRAVRAAGRVDRVAVGTGPGSYNGLRSAIAAAEGLHLATGAERVGIASPRALGLGEYFAFGDARGGVFWLARILDGSIVDDFELLPPAEMLRRMAERPELRRLSSSTCDLVPGAGVAAPDAVTIARLACHEPAAVEGVEPLYLKPAHITPPRARPAGR